MSAGGDGLLARGIGARYGARKVLHGIDLPPLAPGRVAVLLGPNGSGKSTLLKALAGLVPASGEVQLDGEALGRLGFSERARRVAYLPQGLPDGGRLGVMESVLAALRSFDRHGSDASALAQVQARLEELGIAGLAMRTLGELSGGQRQLVGLAQALVRRPRALLLDEPLSALDPGHQLHVLQRVREATIARGMVTLIVLHDINTAIRHADHVLLMRDGRLLAAGAPSEAITPDLLQAAYQIDARVEHCSQGQPMVIVDAVQ